MICNFKRFKFVQYSGVLGILLLGWSLVDAPLAHADLKVCNDTENITGVAIGHRAKSEWMTEGWWRIPPDNCATLIEGELNSRYFYIYAEDSQTSSQWGGSIFMCTSAREFRIEGLKDCFVRGFERSGFFEIDTGNQANWQIRLSEANQTEPEKKADK